MRRCVEETYRGCRIQIISLCRPTLSMGWLQPGAPNGFVVLVDGDDVTAFVRNDPDDPAVIMEYVHALIDDSHGYLTLEDSRPAPSEVRVAA